MLLDMPQAKAPPVSMIRVDLDAEGFDPETLFNKEFWTEATFYGWSGPNQAHKEISPRITSFIKKEGVTDKGNVQPAGWDKLIAELTLIGQFSKEPLFQIAAGTLSDKREDLVAALTEASKKLSADEIAYFEKRKKDKSLPPWEKPPTHLLFYVNGAALQEQEAYSRYRKVMYHAERTKKSVVLTDALGELHPVLLTSPGKHKGACLGSNIPPNDRESCSWGYDRNSRMWIDDDEYMARLAGLNTLVASYTLTTGETNREYLHIALVDMANRENSPFPKLLAWAFNPQDENDPSLWLPQELRSFWENVPEIAPAPTNPDLRLAIYWTEKTSLRLVTYEPLDQSTLLRSLRQFREHYGKLKIPTLVECLSAPKSKRQPLTKAEARRWIRRVFKGDSATLSEAMRALTRYLIELKSGANDSLRSVAQIKIMEDYMESHPVDSPAFYAVGVCVSKFADLAYRTGALSHQNGKDNAFAKNRKGQFTQRFIPLAVASPVQALNQMADKVTMYIRAIPGQYRNKAAGISMQRDRILHAALTDIAAISGGRTPHDKLAVWKGYADDQMEQVQAYQERLQNDEPGKDTNGGSEHNAPE